MIDGAQEPSGFRCIWFSQIWRYSFRHSHFSYLHPSFQSGFSGVENAPLPSLVLLQQIHSFGTRLEPRYVLGAPPLDQW